MLALCNLKTWTETVTFVVPIASFLHFIHASNLTCSFIFGTGSYQFLQKDNNKSLCGFPLFSHPLSLVFFSPLELLKSFTCWSNQSRSISAHIPSSLILSLHLCSCLPLPLHYPLSSTALWWKLFWYLPCCGECEGFHVSLQKHPLHIWVKNL